MPRPIFALTTVLLLAAGPLAAQEGDSSDVRRAGAVRLTVGDTSFSLLTTSSVYDTVRVGSASISPVDPDDTSAGAKQLLSLMATATLEGGTMINIVMEYAKSPGEDGAVVLAEYADDVLSLPLWSAGAKGHPPPTVTFDSFSFDGKTGAMVGSFTADLCKTLDWGAEPDPNDCMTMTGQFDTELYLGL